MHVAASNDTSGKTSVLLRRPYVAMSTSSQLVIARFGPWHRWMVPLIVGIGIAAAIVLYVFFGNELTGWSLRSQVILGASLSCIGIATTACYTLQYSMLTRDRHNLVIRRWALVWPTTRQVPLEWVERVKIRESSRTGEGPTSASEVVYHMIVLIEKNQTVHTLISGLRFRKALDAHRVIDAFVREQLSSRDGAAT